jgi:hypothetical protein
MILFAFVVLLLLSPLQSVQQYEGRTTLYSVNKHRAQQRQSCLKFQGQHKGYVATCDIRYGALYVGDNLDWFESSAAGSSRSVIKDLGAHNWTEKFEVPVVAPLAKLKPGEQRRITIDASGAPGADGRSATSSSAGPPGLRTTAEADVVDGGGRLRDVSRIDSTNEPTLKSEPKHREPKVDPMFVKAIPGHMYVIHVVDDVRDFYVLFRVESIERGDNCTISWRLIPTPENTASKQSK